jgi:hypothetical protein
MGLLLTITAGATMGTTPAPSLDPTAGTLPSMPTLRPEAADCPVTIPGPAPEAFAERLFGSTGAYGNDDLWVGGLPTIGVIIGEPRWLMPDGSISWKLGWWRIESGQLIITGRRLDGPAPPLRGHVPDGYGSTGFQASGVDLPTDGCWEVTGSVGDASLSVVVFVQRTWKPR